MLHISNMQNSIYSHKNEKRGRLECLAPVVQRKRLVDFMLIFDESKILLVRVFLHVSFHMIVKLVSVLKVSIARTLFRLGREEEIINSKL